MQNEQKPSQPGKPPVARIRAACLRKGWNVGELARRTGLSRTTLYQLERGATRRPRAATMHKIAAALETEPGTLFACEGLRSVECPAFCRPACDSADLERQRAFDRSTNPVVGEVSAELSGLFLDWTQTDWDELYSSFGTGGQLTRHGVVDAAAEMNRKRETVRQLHVVLETHLAEVAARMLETLYDMVRPDGHLADTAELETLLAQHRAGGVGQLRERAE